MKIEFLSILHSPPAWFSDFRDQYIKKISAFFPVSVTELKAQKKGREQKEQKLKQESELLLKQVDPRDYLILLDEKGKKLDSLSLAGQIEKILGFGKSRIVICCGGAYGSNEELKARADLMLSLSPLTFNHLVAQAVAYEQIYRAFSIIKGLPYHNE